MMARIGAAVLSAADAGPQRAVLFGGQRLRSQRRHEPMVERPLARRSRRDSRDAVGPAAGLRLAGAPAFAPRPWARRSGGGGRRDFGDGRRVAAEPAGAPHGAFTLGLVENVLNATHMIVLPV